jgi:phosphatidylglycerophosphatase A
VSEPSPSPTRAARRPWEYGWAVWLATGFWAGFFPFAPGTVGAVWGLPLAWGLSHLPLAGQLAILAVLFAAGVPLCTAAAKELGVKDPGSIVWDEIVSMGVVFLGVPLTPATLAAGFALHRLFDITKPPPIRRLERWPDGLGIMADDLLAGIYAAVVLHLLLRLGVFGSLASG